MAYVVSALPAYVNQNKRPLLAKSILTAKTVSLITIQPGVKGQASLNIIDDTSTFQADACTFNPLDSTTLTQRIITVGRIKVDKSWCPIDLEGKYAEVDLTRGSNYDSIPFEQVWAELQADTIAAQLEIAVWQGDLSSGNANLNKFDGLIKIISGCTGYITGSTTGFGATTALSAVTAVYNAIPATILAKPDVRIFLGLDYFRFLQANLTTLNLFHYTGDTENFELTLPGTNVKVVAVNGLNGTNKIVAARTSNLFFGVDLAEDSAKFKMWYSEDNEQVRMTVKFRAGTQVAFCGEIVMFA